MNTKKWALAIGIVLLAIFLLWHRKEGASPAVQDGTAVTVVRSSMIAVDAKAPAPEPIAASTKRIAALTVSETIDEYVDWQLELVASLIALDDADSLLAAALILHALNAEDPVERRKIALLLQRAHLAAPGDRAISSVALRVCRSMPGCNAARYEDVVRNIDARNALWVMTEVQAKIEKGSPEEATEFLEALARLRLNLYHGELAARVLRAISSAPTSPRFAPATGDLLRIQSELTLRAVDAVEVPSYLAVSSACQVQNWRNTRPCESIVRDLGRSELIELQRLGLAFDASDNRGKRSADVIDTETYLNWVSTTKANNPPPASQWIALLAQHRTEVAATRVWLERNGITAPRVPRWLERVR